MLGCARYRFDKKRNGTRDAELVFWHPLESVGTECIPVCPGREMSTHYFSCLGGTGAVSIKNATDHVTPNLCFCIQSGVSRA
jgi:hypothetical protein